MRIVFVFAGCFFALANCSGAFAKNPSRPSEAAGVEVRQIVRPEPADAPTMGWTGATDVESATTPRKLREEQVGRLADLWSLIRFGYIDAALGGVDVDAPFEHALTSLHTGAVSAERFRDAVRRLLEQFHDADTALVPTSPVASAEPSIDADGPAGGFLRLTVTMRRGRPLSWRELESVAIRLAQADRVVIRVRGSEWDDAEFRTLLPLLIGSELTLPESRAMVHEGYEPPSLREWATYRVRVSVSPRAIVSPAHAGHWRRSVFVFEEGPLPGILHALQRSGDVHVVTIPGVSNLSRGDTATIPIDAAWSARVRVSGGTCEHRVVVDAVEGTLEAALTRAARIARQRARRTSTFDRATSCHPPATASRRRDEHAPSGELPPVGRRMLALVKYWGTLRSFDGYPERLERWEELLPELMPRVEAANTYDAYVDVLSEAARRVHDGHAAIWSERWSRTVGNAAPPITVRFVEEQPTIVAIADEITDIARGDIIRAIDGVPVSRRVEELKKRISASNEAGLGRVVGDRLLWGQDGSIVELRVDGPAGDARVVRMTRSVAHREKPLPLRRGPAFRVLPSGTGYVDLASIDDAEFDEALATIRGTRATVLDMRGYPAANEWPLVARMRRGPVRPGPLFAVPVLSFVDATWPLATEWRQYRQPLPASDGSIYEGRTVMLIDENTQSASEHLGLFLEALNGTEFVGSSSAGANGDVSWLALPGGINAFFSGAAVTHFDGRPLQGVGLRPTVTVTPTIHGVRAGRDEVLERAVSFLVERGSHE